MVSTPIGSSTIEASQNPPNIIHSPIPLPSNLISARQAIPTPIPLPIIPNSTIPLMQAMPNYQPSVPYYPTIPNILANTNNQGHTFPVLCTNPQISPLTEIQPVPLYSEYIHNPYNLAAASPPYQTENNQNIQDEQKNVQFDANRNSEETILLESNLQTNVFQSANYFCNSSTQNFIPPGSEILFGDQKSNLYTSNLQGANIPLLSNPNPKSTN